MNATIISRTPTSFTLQVEVPYNDSMLDFEETLQERLNDAGVTAIAEGLKQFDTDGSPITVGPVKFTSKGQVEKDYQTPYGVATVGRHVYQSPEGGPTYCPLDRDARIVVTSTPRFAKVLSHKYAEFSSPRVQIDLEENHGRTVSRCLIQDVADAVAAAVLAKEEDWSYALPKFEEPPVTVAISLDGTCLQIREDGWRETMVGTLASTTGRGSDSTRSTSGRRPSTARRSSSAGWRRRSSVPRRSARRPITWGSPTGPRGTGTSWGGTPTSR